MYLDFNFGYVCSEVIYQIAIKVDDGTEPLKSVLDHLEECTQKDPIFWEVIIPVRLKRAGKIKEIYVKL